jgi:hypothetical protein
MDLRKQRIRRLTILAALILLGAGGLWVSRTHGSEGDEATTPAPSPITNPQVSQADCMRQVLTLALGAINCARVNAGLNEVKIDKALTAEAITRLEALFSPRKGSEYEAMVQEGQIKSVYRVVFVSAIETNACSLPWFSIGEGEELTPLEDQNIKKVGLAGAPDGNRLWIMMTWR